MSCAVSCSANNCLHLVCPLQMLLRRCSSPIWIFKPPKFVWAIFVSNSGLRIVSGNHGCCLPRLDWPCNMKPWFRILLPNGHPAPSINFTIPSPTGDTQYLCPGQTALCSWTGYPQGAINFRLSSPFPSLAPPGRGHWTLRNLSITCPRLQMSRCRPRCAPIPDPASWFRHPQWSAAYGVHSIAFGSNFPQSPPEHGCPITAARAARHLDILRLLGRHWRFAQYTGGPPVSSLVK